MHVIAGNRRQPDTTSQRLQFGKALTIAAVQEQFYGEPGAPWKALRQPEAIRVGRGGLRQPDRQAIRQWMLGQLLAVQAVTTLRGLPPAQRDEGRQLPVAGPVRCQQHEPEPILEPELATDNQRQGLFARFLMRLDDPGQRTFIGQGQRGIAEPGGFCNQFLRVGGTAQEAVIAQRMELGIGDSRIIEIPAIIRTGHVDTTGRDARVRGRSRASRRAGRSRRGSRDGYRPRPTSRSRCVRAAVE